MMPLRCQPLRRYGCPSYPTRLHSLADPELLRRHLPCAWLSQRQSAAAAMGVLLAALLGGCSSKAAAGGQSAATPGRPAIVAPVYEYVLEKGEPPWWMIEDRRLVLARDPSRILPPLLSEENALLIIREEAQRAGLAFTEEDVALSAVTAEVVLREEQYDWVSETTAQSLCRGTQPIRLALYDPTRRVGIFYAPRPAWGRFPAELDWSGVYNEAYPRETAKTISKKVAEQATDIYFVALYDPSQYVFRPCPWEEVYVGPEESGAAGGAGVGQASFPGRPR